GRWISGFWFLFLVLVFCRWRASLAVWFDFFDLVRRRRRTELLVYSFSGGLWSWNEGNSSKKNSSILCLLTIDSSLYVCVWNSASRFYSF
ncbi:hypothetical protein VIGAN_10196300, partial [Vigna angularis var. angularis]